jgi:autotransporter-associated beta strand protein
LTISNLASLAGTITTTGNQIYNGAVTLVGDTNLSTTLNGNITFNSSVDSQNVDTPRALTLSISDNNTTYYWVDWTTVDDTAKTISGTITIGGQTVNVTYSNPQGWYGVQTSGGTNYWTSTNSVSPYTSSSIGNAPVTEDIIQLQYAGNQSLTFSQSIENIAFAVVSLNGNGLGFNRDFTIVSQTGVNGAGDGYWGGGTLTKSTSGSTFNLNGTSGEPHGVIQFTSSFTTLTWNSISNELWNGFTVGVSGITSQIGRTTFNGTVGTVPLGAITVNGALTTTQAINSAQSLSVSRSSVLGGSIATSGSQIYSGAVNLNSNVNLTTSSNGNIVFAGSVDGASSLEVTANGTGTTKFADSIGSATTLTGLNISSSALTATNINLSSSSAISLNLASASSVTGSITGLETSLSKLGGGTLTLSGTNTYTGDTFITTGTLRTTGTLSPSTDVVMTNDATWDLQATQTIASLSMASGNTIVRSDGTSSLTVSGVSTLANGITTSGAQTYTGAVTLDANTILQIKYILSYLNNIIILLKCFIVIHIFLVY